MRKFLNFTLFLGLIILASCSSEIDMRNNPLLLPGQVKFTTTIGAEATTRVIGNQWEAGDAIGVYALNAGSTIPGGIYGKENAKFTNPLDDIVGEFTAATPDDFITFPKDGSKLDFVAYYPYTETVVEYKLPVDVSNQTESALIDYLYVNNEVGASKSEPIVNLAFKHKMAQLVLEFSTDTGMSLDDLTAVIKGMKTDGSLHLLDGSVTPGETVGDITPLLSTDKKTAVAIIVPGQNMEDVTVEIIIDGKTYTWTPSAENLESGKRYTFKLKLTQDDVVLDNVGATIEDWEDADIGSDDIILNPDGEEDVEEPEAESLLAPGMDFEDWALFEANSSEIKAFVKQSDDGMQGKALSISGDLTKNEPAFTVLVPEGFSAEGATHVSFWLKGTSVGKSMSINVYEDNTTYKHFTVGSITEDTELEAASGNNNYTGGIDTNGEWVKISLKLGDIVLNNNVGEKLVSFRVGKDATFDLLIDNIILEGDFEDDSDDPIVEATLEVDKTEVALGADENLTATVSVTTELEWTATSNAAWLVVDPQSATGNKAVTLTATENTVTEERTATVTFKATGVEDEVVTVIQAAAEEEETPDEPLGDLLFPGGDFEDWDAFKGGLSTHDLQDYATQVDGGRNGSKALHIKGTPSGNDFLFTALVPEGFAPTGKNAIVFYMKGTAGKSLSLNVYKAGGGYQAFNLDEYKAERVIEPAASNQYNGEINTGGDWMKVVVDISSIDLNTTVGQNLFAVKVGKDVVYDLLLDDFTLETLDIKTFRVDKTSLSFAAAGDLSGTVNLTSTEAWTATSSAAWLTVSPASGNDSKAVTVTATENEVQESRSATVTFKAAGMDDIVVNVTQAARPGEVDPDSNLLFPGSDFEDWDEFISSLGFTEKYIVQSAEGEGRNNSKALKLEVEKTDNSNGYLFTANAPSGFSASGKTEINFWIKGVSQGRSISIDIVTTDGKKYYNLGSLTSDVTLPPTGQNAYVGDINTGGDWVKVTLDLSALEADIVTSGNLISFKYGKEGGYDLYIDDITIE